MGQESGPQPLAPKDVVCGSRPIWKVKHQATSGPSTIRNTVEVIPSTSQVAELASKSQKAPMRMMETVEGADVVVESESDPPLHPNAGLTLIFSQKSPMTSSDASAALSLKVVPSAKVLQFSWRAEIYLQRLEVVRTLSKELLGLYRD